ncbi:MULTISPECIES: DUF2846 domain-containing protein [Cupriavidus]
MFNSHGRCRIRPQRKTQHQIGRAGYRDMGIKGILLAAGAAAWLASGCASGPSFQDVQQAVPVLRAGEGRIFFLRSASMFGAAIQPELRIDEEVVGRSRPGGFFFVDRKPGSFVASATTEVETTLPFKLAAGETKYLRTAIDFGLLVGHVVLTEDSPERARAELASLAYTGDLPVPADGPGKAGVAAAVPVVPAAPAVPAAAVVAATATAIPAPAAPAPGAAVPAPPRAAAQADGGTVRMDDLRYLMLAR